MDTLGEPFDYPTILYSDSTSAETFNQGNTSRMKALRIQYSDYEHNVSTGSISTRHVSTDNMLADILTKALDPTTFQRIVKRVMWKKH
jgi:hypothetical protein